MAADIITHAQAKARGLKRYFTGKACLAGHITERSIGGECLACQVVRLSRSAEKVKRQKREWNRKNRKRENLRFRVYREKNLEKERLKFKVWYGDNRLRVRERNRRWRAENVDLFMCTITRRRARKMGAPGFFSKEDIDYIRKLQNGRCAEPSCRASFNHVKETIDHIISLSKGPPIGLETFNCSVLPAIVQREVVTRLSTLE